jgi:hypothetical protein
MKWMREMKASIKPDDMYKNLEKLKSVEDRMTYTHYSQQEDWIIKI